MQQVPETRESLILRLPSAADADAWNEFVSIYEPFVYRFGRRSGLQDADARELVQNVLLSVARAVSRWHSDQSLGKFRTWLFRIARNHLIDTARKSRRQVKSSGGTSWVRLLEMAPDDDLSRIESDTLSCRRELFQWATNRVKGSVKTLTWQAFWLTAIENLPVSVAAERLSVTPGTIYIARSRVMARIREEIRRWEDDDALS